MPKLLIVDVYFFCWKESLYNQSTTRSRTELNIGIIPVLLQDACSGKQSNSTFRRTNEVMTFPCKLVHRLYAPSIT